MTGRKVTVVTATGVMETGGKVTVVIVTGLTVTGGKVTGVTVTVTGGRCQKGR